jgi:hypothetical protein
MRQSVTLVVALMLGGCGPRVGEVDSQSGTDTTESTTDDGSGPGPGPGGNPGSASDVTSTGHEGGEVGDEVDTGFSPDWGSLGCLVSPAFQCSEGVPCDQINPPCGDPMSPFDAYGCLRSSCPCSVGEICFHPSDWGGCASSELFCEDVRGQGCLCGGSDDCGGSYCLAEQDVPALPCLSFEDPVSCAEANCAWFEGGRVSLTPNCSCDPRSGICVPPVEYELGPGPAFYYPIVPPQNAVSLPNALDPIPHGLKPCDDLHAPDACVCLSTFEWSCP